MGLIDFELRRKVLTSINHFAPLVKLPESIKDSVADLRGSERLEIYVLPLHEGEGGNGKRFPAVQLCLDAEKEGRIYPGVVAIVPGSGNTAVNFAYSKDAFGIKKVIAVMNSSVPDGKKAQLLVPGAEIEYPRPGQTTLERAAELEREGVGVFINQYKERGSIKGQNRTMYHLINEMESMDEVPSFFSAAMGTTSMICAAYETLKNAFPKLHIIGGACKDKDNPVPGVRTVTDVERDISFDWKSVIGAHGPVLCSSYDSFAMSRKMILAVRRLFGPSCGTAVQAGLQRFRSLSESGELEEYTNPHGKYILIAPSIDMSLTYGDEYMKVLKLGQK
ncbi:MAG TPA: PLP-dependent lyase/thiolase [Candidatus Paceibacterota bacterium]|nr:PLP-dependent lyase/thiolase [Candidatus Paceibacterota bacterium]